MHEHSWVRRRVVSNPEITFIAVKPDDAMDRIRHRHPARSGGPAIAVAPRFFPVAAGARFLPALGFRILVQVRVLVAILLLYRFIYVVICFFTALSAEIQSLDETTNSAATLRLPHSFNRIY